MVKLFHDEVWEPVPTTKKLMRNKYAITSYGRIISYKNKIEEGKFLKGTLLAGYPTFALRADNTSTTFYIHRVAAKVFLNKPSDAHIFVIHLDHNKKNNHIDNLKWVTKDEMDEHTQKSPKVQASKLRRKEYRPTKGHKLTASDVAKIKRKVFDPNRKLRLKMIAKQFNISEMQLYRIKNGENWAHITVETEGTPVKRVKKTKGF